MYQVRDSEQPLQLENTRTISVSAFPAITVYQCRLRTVGTHAVI